MATAPPFDAAAIAKIDGEYRARIGTLFSLDDMVAGIAAALDAQGIADSTYVVFTSDNGYHLGQHRMPPAKVLPFETDIRLPFFARGQSTCHVAVAPPSSLLFR